MQTHRLDKNDLRLATAQIVTLKAGGAAGAAQIRRFVNFEVVGAVLTPNRFQVPGFASNRFRGLVSG
jgi:hypothetical protein